MNIVMSSQNHAMKTNTVKTSTKKLRKVKPSLTNSIAILHVSDAQNGRSSPTTRTEAAWRHGLSARSGDRLARLEIPQHRETGNSPKEVLERFLLGYRTELLRASRLACAFFVACDTLPIFAGGTRVRGRRLGSARMPSLGVSPVGGRVEN